MTTYETKVLQILTNLTKDATLAAEMLALNFEVFARRFEHKQPKATASAIFQYGDRSKADNRWHPHCA